MLGILFDLCLDISYKQDGFFKTFLKEGIEFIPSKGDSIVAFNQSFVLLPVEVNPIIKEQSCKRDLFIDYRSGFVEIILT